MKFGTRVGQAKMNCSPSRGGVGEVRARLMLLTALIGFVLGSLAGLTIAMMQRSLISFAKTPISGNLIPNTKAGSSFKRGVLKQLDMGQGKGLTFSDLIFFSQKYVGRGCLFHL